MLNVSGLTAHYGASQALFGIDLVVGKGQVATLLGRNGMGKTTTIHALMGIVRASAGTIVFDGTELSGLKSHQIARLGLGLVPEGRQIFPNLTTMENLVATASNHRDVARPWTVQTVLALFPELATRTGSMGSLLSGGEQQMLAIGRALMTNPRLLILDEATEGLAPQVRKKIWTALSEIAESGMSILVVDKNLHDLMRIADVHHILQRGQVVWRGASAALAEDIEMRQRYLGL